MPNIGSSPVSLNHQPGLIVQSSTGIRTDPMVELYADPTTHRLLVDAGSITATNPSVSTTAQAVPSQATYIGGNKSGNLVGLSLDSSGNLNVNLAAGTISGGNAAASATGSAVPASADYTGFNSGGNLVGVSTANPLPVIQQGSVAVTGTFWQTTQPVSGTVTANIGTSGSLALDATLTGGTQQTKITDGTNTATVKAASTAAVAADKALVVAISPNNSVAVTGAFWQSTQPVSLASLPALASGTNSIGTVQPGNTANTTPWLVTDTPATSGGLTAYKLISAASTNAASVKGSAGQLYAIAAFNTTASVAYLKLYNKASAPTVGTDTPVHTFVLPANSTNGAGLVLSIDKGIGFSLGIALAITGAITDADTTAVAANQVVVNLDYK